MECCSNQPIIESAIPRKCRIAARVQPDYRLLPQKVNHCWKNCWETAPLIPGTTRFLANPYPHSAESTTALIQIKGGIGPEG